MNAIPMEARKLCQIPSDLELQEVVSHQVSAGDLTPSSEKSGSGRTPEALIKTSFLSPLSLFLLPPPPSLFLSL